MPVVTITNTDLIFITLNIDGVNSVIKKDWATTSVSGTNLILKWFNEVESRTYNYEQTIAYTDVNPPVTGNATALKAVVDGYLTNSSTPGGGYNLIEDEGVPLSQRNTLNFVGSGVSAADSGGETVVTIPGGSVVTPAALTKTDDTNVTLTLGGTPATALLEAVSLTLGWSGTLADVRIASAATWNAKQNALGFTPEDVANKDTDGTLAANSDTKYASQKATKAYADTKAPIASPIFTGTPEAPTPTAGDNSTKVATTAFVRASSLLFAYSRTTATGTAIITEEVIASVLIPAGTLGNNDSIEIWALWGGTGLLATIKSMKIRLHTSVAVAGTTYGLVTTSVGSGSFAFNAMAKIYQKNATNIQEGTLGASASGGWGGAGAAVVTSALSNASDMYIVFTTTKAISTETINLNSFDIKINRAT